MSNKELQEKIKLLEQTVELLEKELELRKALSEYAGKHPTYVPYPVPQYPYYPYPYYQVHSTGP